MAPNAYDNNNNAAVTMLVNRLRTTNDRVLRGLQAASNDGS